MLHPLPGLGRDLHDALPTHLKVRPANPFDALSLARHVRPADGAEILAWGMSPVEGISVSIARAAEVWAVVDGDETVALFGCREEAPGVGHPWLLCGAPVMPHRKTILRFGKGMIERWGRRWPLLVTWSWLGNPPHHRWLAHLGFTPVNIIPAGVLGALTYEFVRITPHGS